MKFESRFGSQIKSKRDQLRPNGVRNPHEIFAVTKTNNK